MFAVSGHLHSFTNWLRDHLTRNQTFQNEPDWIKLRGVDERVGADIEKLREYCTGKADLHECHYHTCIRDPLIKNCLTTFQHDECWCRCREIQRTLSHSSHYSGNSDPDPGRKVGQRFSLATMRWRRIHKQESSF